MSRLKTLLFICLCFSSAYCLGAALSSDEALEQLVKGNQRFCAGQNTHTQWNQEARSLKSGPQEPFAVILSCSDSRVPPEIIFDQGLGNLFVVRVAGNVVGDIELASIEYGVAHLHAPLILVLGHQGCGAVTAVLKEKESDAGLRSIYPLISAAIKQCDEKQKDALKNAIYCNVKSSMQKLHSTPVIASHLKQKSVKIVGGYYDFQTGKVTLIPLEK